MTGQNATQLLERATACRDDVFRAKFVHLPGHIRQWTAPFGGLEGKRVLDFGCGSGTTACAIAATCDALFVDGVDINREHEMCAKDVRENLQLDGLPDNLTFRTLQPADRLEERRYDVVYSWSVFEHIDRDIFDEVVRNIRASLVDGGLLFVQIAPLYYSAEGSHLARYGVRAWEHLSLQLNKLKAIVFGNASLTQEEKSIDWSCFETLNKLTARELVDLVAAQGFEVIRTYQTNNDRPPPPALQSIYDAEVLCTEQIVALFRKRAVS